MNEAIERVREQVRTKQDRWLRVFEEAIERDDERARISSAAKIAVLSEVDRILEIEGARA